MIVLFDLCLTNINKKRCNHFDYNVLSNFLSDPTRIRTWDPQLRRLMLYPAELPDHLLHNCECKDKTFLLMEK